MSTTPRHKLRFVPRLPSWRSEALRTTLWLVPAIEIAVAIALFMVTYLIDRAAYRGTITLPGWVTRETPDAARTILTAMAASVITVVGLVFSITIVALTLTSTQFGPRMLRNFIRDRGTQLTLGTFVATFVFCLLTLGAISRSAQHDFVPSLSITVALTLVLVDLGVLVYFIHHVAKSIQLPEVIAGIAGDLTRAIDAEIAAQAVPAGPAVGLSPTEVMWRLEENGVAVNATSSGYLQYVGLPALVAIATDANAVVELLYRPGHFVVEGLPLARVWPADASPGVARALERAHVTGAHRTLTQDPAFAIDQLVEIAIRALSPAVNDTFTALTCIDWLGAGLCRLSQSWNPQRVHRDDSGHVRVLSAPPSYRRLVQRAFDKIRQAGRGMPAVLIRQLDALSKVMAYTTSPEQRDVLLKQGEMIVRASEESVPEPSDRADVRRRYDGLVAIEMVRA